MKINHFSFIGGILILNLFFYSCNSGEDVQSADKIAANRGTVARQIPVEVMIVQPQDVQKGLNLSGLLQPIHSVDIVAKVSGNIEKINKELGARVNRNDILAVIDDKVPLSNFEQSKSQVLSAENNLKIARLNLLSDEELYKNGDISKLEYENSLLAVKTAEANHLSALATLSLMEKTYKDTRITSPINGFVSRKYIDLGMMVNPNSPVYRVVDLSALKIEVGIPQELIRYIEKGTKAKIKLSAFGNEMFDGAVEYISPQAETSTGAFNVEIHVPNTPDQTIKAGLTGRVEIILNNKQGQLVVPDFALINRADSSFVYIVQNQRAILTHVKLGEAYQSEVVVDEGLTAGDTLVVVGMKNLTDRAHVWIESVD